MSGERSTRPLVIGVGNTFRGDDGVGPDVVQRLASDGFGAVADLAVADGEPTRLLDLWREAERVVLVDAMRADAAAGTVVVVDALAGPVPTHGRAASSHAAGLGDAVALGRALGRLPESLWIVGVVGDRFEIGADRSPPVAAAVGAAAAAVRALA